MYVVVVVAVVVAVAQSFGQWRRIQLRDVAAARPGAITWRHLWRSQALALWVCFRSVCNSGRRGETVVEVRRVARQAMVDGKESEG